MCDWRNEVPWRVDEVEVEVEIIHLGCFLFPSYVPFQP